MNILARAKLSRNVIFPSPAKPSFALLPLTAPTLKQCSGYATRTASQKAKLSEDAVEMTVPKEIGKFDRKKQEAILALWRDAVKDPQQWFDYRARKANGLLPEKYPDLKHKVSHEALWLSAAPSWALPGFEKLEFDVKGTEDPWKSLVENPSKWWDNRVGKKNPKSPDFKNKEDGEGLWLSDAPSWVSTTELENLVFDIKDVSREDSWRNLVEDSTKWWDNRLWKKNPKSPDFKHKESGEGLWLNDAPSWVSTQLENLVFAVKDVSGGGKGEELWKSLVDNPSKWWDNRSRKTIPRGPDFSHKESKEGLWVDSAPSWVLPDLENLVFNVSGKTKGEDSWKSLVADTSKWWDNRLRKKNPKSPDFKHKENGEGLWLNDAPSWVSTKLENLVFAGKNGSGEGKKDSKDEDFWKSFVDDFSKWWDNRVGKRNPKAPDFKHKETGEGIWADSIPEWVLAKLPPPM